MPSSLANSVSSATFRTAGIDAKCDFGAANYAYVDNWQRIGLHELHTRTFAVALQFVWRLALEAFQLRNIQTRILLNDQLVGAHVDAVQRGRCLLKVISTIKRLCQHHFCVG